LRVSSLLSPRGSRNVGSLPCEKTGHFKALSIFQVKLVAPKSR
jgi:hypothetical protein